MGITQSNLVSIQQKRTTVGKRVRNQWELSQKKSINKRGQYWRSAVAGVKRVKKNNTRFACHTTLAKSHTDKSLWSERQVYTFKTF